MLTSRRGCGAESVCFSREKPQDNDIGADSLGPPADGMLSTNIATVLNQQSTRKNGHHVEEQYKSNMFSVLMTDAEVSK
jgi:hypothetical protein